MQFECFLIYERLLYMIYTPNLKSYIHHLVSKVIVPDTALDPEQ